MSKKEPTKEERRKSMDYAIGMSKVDGGEPSPEVLAIMERKVNGELTADEVVGELNKLYATRRAHRG